MPSTRSRAATKCISEVPGLAKHTLTPPATRVRTRLSAPFMTFLQSLHEHARRPALLQSEARCDGAPSAAFSLAATEVRPTAGASFHLQPPGGNDDTLIRLRPNGSRK